MPVTPSEPVSSLSARTADGGVGRGLCCRSRPSGRSGVGADAVVVAVGTDHAAVQTNVSGLVGRNYAQLGAEEVSLGDAVLLVEDASCRFSLTFSAALSSWQRAGADEDIQLLAVDAFAQGLAVIWSAARWGSRSVTQKTGVALVLADADGHSRCRRLRVNDAVQGQGDGRSTGIS